MANRNGNIYGLTILSPILEGSEAGIPHNLAIRNYLADLPRDGRDPENPFTKLSSTHMARLAVLDVDALQSGVRVEASLLQFHIGGAKQVAHSDSSNSEEYLTTQYLIFESNFDGDLDSYLVSMVRETPEFVNSVWRHCEGFPGVVDLASFASYMKKCQVDTSFYYADVNDKTVQQTLQALRNQGSLRAFILRNQGKPADEIQKAFAEFAKSASSSSDRERTRELNP
jgi:hypothetical protein